MWSLPGDTLVNTAGAGVTVGVAARVSIAVGVGLDRVAGVGAGAAPDLSDASGAGLDIAVAGGPDPGAVVTERGSARPPVACADNVIAVGDGSPVAVGDAVAVVSIAGAAAARAVELDIRGRSPVCDAVISLRGSGSGRGLSPQPPTKIAPRTSPATAPARQRLVRGPMPVSARATFRRNGRRRLLCTSQPADSRTVHNPCRESQQRQSPDDLRLLQSPQDFLLVDTQKL